MKPRPASNASIREWIEWIEASCAWVDRQRRILMYTLIAEVVLILALITGAAVA